MLTDVDLIKKVKEEQDSTALNELVTRHTGIYIDILKRYTSHAAQTRTDMAIEKQDMMSDKTLNIYLYALDYDPNKNMKFSVYLGKRLKWDCIGAYNNSICSREIGTSDFPDLPDDKISSDEETIKFIVESTSEIQDERFLEIFKLRHMQDKPVSWKKIGKVIGMTSEGARKVYNHNVEFLRNRIKKEQLINE